MVNCTMCGVEIPKGQNGLCSMCYGDPYYGNDGYYLAMMRKHEEEARAEAQWEAQMEAEGA